MAEFWFNPSLSPLTILTLVLMAGMLGGWIARRLHAPSITGNIVAGIIIGPSCLNLFSGTNVTANLQPLSTFAMGLVAMSMGSHLSYRSIHNALRRIVTIALCEATAVIVCVTLCSLALGAGWLVAFMLGCIAVETAPATILALIREMRAKGTFSKTLLSVVAIDNIICITLFAFARALMADYFLRDSASLSLSGPLLHTTYRLLGSACLGFALGIFTERLVRHIKEHHFSVVFISVLLGVSVSECFTLSPLLTCLILGVYLSNVSEGGARRTRALEPIEPLLFTCFFTMAGVSLHLGMMYAAWPLCLAFLLARITGKSLGASLGGWISRTSRRIWTSTTLGLMPEAGISVGLVVLLSGDARIPGHVSDLIETLVLGAVTINELIGPLFTRYAVRRSREHNKDRRRLIEFLQEEYILTGLKAVDKWDALVKLTDFYMRTHHVPANMKNTLYESIREREREYSTAVGRGAAIPHARIDTGSGIRGVLAICREGVDFDAPDGEPVRLLMLVVTPRGYEKEHLEVMASLAQMISDEAIRTRLLAAIDPNDAWEIIESEDTRNYNYFLTEEAGSPDEQTPAQA